MTKSERIRLIQKLVEALSQEREDIAYLTLNEFGLKPVNLSYDAGPQDHFIASLRRGSDEVLQDIATHFNLPGASLSVDPVAEQRLWTPGFCRCFLSHTSKHKVQAASLKAELMAYGCDAFVAHEDIEPTLEWRREIEAALGTCHCLLALITEDFHGSLWTDQESGFVLGRGLPVISIRAGKDPYGLMDKLQAVPFNEAAMGDVAETIFTALNSKQQTAQHVSSGAVQAFLESQSFADSKKKMGIIERLPTLMPELRHKLGEEAAKNSQIMNSFGIPGRLTSLLQRA